MKVRSLYIVRLGATTTSKLAIAMAAIRETTRRSEKR